VQPRHVTSVALPCRIVVYKEGVADLLQRAAQSYAQGYCLAQGAVHCCGLPR
jgi:hypothetical protein